MSRPMRRTSSLNRSRSGSISFNFMCSGKPPTLWWLLMVWLGPFTLLDSITSGYSVPCTSQSTPPVSRAIRAASSSKTAINSLPIVLRFFSGSVTPASLLRKRSLASTATRFNPSLSRRFFCTLSNSFLRSTPLFTKTHVNWLPMALCTSIAATEESTPPESPQMT